MIAGWLALCLAGSLDPQAIQRLEKAAQQANSSALIVQHQGENVVSWYEDGGPGLPLEAQSVTKSITALVMGNLVGTAALPSLDVAVAEFYPEWRQGKNRLVTVRHLLTHTSCLQNAVAPADEISQAPDVVQLALTAELSCAPGSVFSYNNKAVNLLAGIVERVSGEPLDRFAERTLFEPLGITRYDWVRDSAGNPFVTGGVQIMPEDLAKIGTLVAHDGIWEGRHIIPAGWVAALTTASALRSDYGLLWWMPGPTLLQKLTGHHHAAIVAQGWMGQYLYIVPEEELVIVRMYDVKKKPVQSGDHFESFLSLAPQLLSSPSS